MAEITRLDQGRSAIEPPDFFVETTKNRDGYIQVRLSATCTRVEHAVFLHKAAEIIEQLCSIAPPPSPTFEIDADWAE